MIVLGDKHDMEGEDLRHPAAVVEAAAQGASGDGEMMTSYYRDDLTGLPEMGVVAEPR